MNVDIGPDSQCWCLVSPVSCKSCDINDVSEVQGRTRGGQGPGPAGRMVARLGAQLEIWSLTAVLHQ